MQRVKRRVFQRRPEIIIESCERQYTAKGEAALDLTERQILDAAQNMASEALRVLAVAMRQIPASKLRNMR